jgi:hypothetical protein
MSTTVIELIALEIVRRLEEITIDNGYSFDVVAVVRPDREGKNYTPEDKLIEVTQGDSIRNTEMSLPGNPPATAYDTEFEINCFVRESDHDTTGYNAIQNERGSQIIKAIVNESTDVSTWHTLDGNALLAEIGDVKGYSTSDGHHNGVSVMLSVLHRQSETDPYVVRS